MNRIFRHKYTIFSLMAAMAMLMVSATGCIMDNEEPGTPDDEGLMMVSFRVVTPNQTAASRGVTPPDGSGNWGTIDPNDPGTEFDNLLLPNQLKVFITDDQSNSLAEVTMLSLSGPSATGEREYIGFITGDDTFENVQSKGAKLHVIANAGNDLTDTNGEINSDKSFEKSGQGFDAIPMWGVATVQKKPFSEMKKGERFEVQETIWLLRAMAKVEILLKEPIDDNYIQTLTGATLDGVNGSGYLLPLSTNTGWKTVSETKALSYDDSFRPLKKGTETATINATPQDNAIVFYLPDCANPNGDTANELAINVSYTTKETPEGGQPETGTIYFRPYENGTANTTGDPYNIVRNHLYRFTITGIDPNSQLTLQYTVCPWLVPSTVNPPTFE